MLIEYWKNHRYSAANPPSAQPVLSRIVGRDEAENDQSCSITDHFFKKHAIYWLRFFETKHDRLMNRSWGWF